MKKYDFELELVEQWRYETERKMENFGLISKEIKSNTDQEEQFSKNFFQYQLKKWSGKYCKHCEQPLSIGQYRLCHDCYKLQDDTGVEHFNITDQMNRVKDEE